MNRPPQPAWLYEITYGLTSSTKNRVLIDGTRFAIVQSPGGMWYDNSGGHYGGASYHLVDKQKKYRPAHGLLDTIEVQSGGRAKTAQWKRLVDSLDKGEPMKVFVLLGSDDYASHKVLNVYFDKRQAEKDVADKIYEERGADGIIALISRQGSPRYEIVEKDVK